MVVSANKVATEVADKWGPALTKAVMENDVTDFKNLFSKEPVLVVLQNAEGTEADFTIGDEGATMTWEEFQELTMADLKEQKFAKTESQCLGVLGDRLILETARFNQSGEVYSEAYALLTFNEDGKITAFDAFTNPQAEGLMAAVADKV